MVHSGSKEEGEGKQEEKILNLFAPLGCKPWLSPSLVV
jgi:hypothetical protein